MPPRISIVVLTHNRQHSLADLLDDLDRLGDSVHEILVVDNCSSDGTPDLVQRQWPSIRYFRSERNIGVAARNIGLRAASGEVAITLDDDIVGLTRASVVRVQNSFLDEPRLGALNFGVLDYFSGKVCNWVHHRPSEDAERCFGTYEITEGAVAFRTEALRSTNYYHEAYFISHEGPDLAFRLMNAGYIVAYDGAIKVRHKHEQTARRPDRFYYYDTRNQFWLAARNMPIGYALRYLAIGQAAMGWYALRDRHPVPWLRGIRDGLRGLHKALSTRQPWTSETAAACRQFDRQRLSHWHMIRKRLFSDAKRLDG
jgi:GT2 family glycosyltransferase